MPKQEFITTKTIKMKELEYGQLGRILNEGYDGYIVTKTFSNYTTVYSPNKDAFYCTFDDSVAKHLDVEILNKDEKVVLSN
jgi:hypothetical protein